MQETYEILVKSKLKRYVENKTTYRDLLDRIEMLNNLKSNITVRWGNECIKGGGSSYEDKLLNINAEIETIESNLTMSIGLIEMMDKALNTLNSKERDIVLEIYGTEKRGNKIEKLQKKYSYEQAQLYRIAKSSLKKIALQLYGDY